MVELDWLLLCKSGYDLIITLELGCVFLMTTLSVRLSVFDGNIGLFVSLVVANFFSLFSLFYININDTFLSKIDIIISLNFQTKGFAIGLPLLYSY